MRKVIDFLKKKDLYYGLTRYLFVLGMFPYALIKIFTNQFVASPHVWFQPLGTLSPNVIGWTFFGLKDWFQITIGLMEFIPMLLIMFRRTALLGAILVLPLLIEILMILFSLDLWGKDIIDFTIAISLLVLNILIFVFEWKRVKEIFLIVIAKGNILRKKWLEWSFNVIFLGVLFYLFGPMSFNGHKKIFGSPSDKLTGDWRSYHPYEWVLKSEKYGDSVVENYPKDLLYFLPKNSYVEIQNNLYPFKYPSGYYLNDKTHVLSLRNYSNDGKLSGKYNYTLTGDTILQIEKIVDSVKMIKQTSVYKRRIKTFGKQF